jgi:hypothetical protein
MEPQTRSSGKRRCRCRVFTPENGDGSAIFAPRGPRFSSRHHRAVSPSVCPGSARCSAKFNAPRLSSIATMGARFGIDAPDARSWLNATEWDASTQVDQVMLLRVAETLRTAGVGAE